MGLPRLARPVWGLVGSMAHMCVSPLAQAVFEYEMGEHGLTIRGTCPSTDQSLHITQRMRKGPPTGKDVAGLTHLSSEDRS